jgi:hypothetical protein
MERRAALRNIAFVVGSMITLPVWAYGISAKAEYFPGTAIAGTENPLLTSIVDTIIPETDTPGAKALGVPALIQKILTDCYDKDVVASFMNGMNWTEEQAKSSYGSPFVNCTTEQRLAILKKAQTEDPATDQAKFIKMAKELTILGFNTSEYVVTKINKYQMVPGHYYGNVPLDYDFYTAKHTK